MTQIAELLNTHGRTEWARYFSEPLEEVNKISGARQKKKYLKRIAKNIPTGYAGVTTVYFTKDGVVLHDDTRKLHANFRIFFKLLNIF